MNTDGCGLLYTHISLSSIHSELLEAMAGVVSNKYIALRPQFPTPSLSQRNLVSMAKGLIPGLGRGTHKRRLECLVALGSKKVLQKPSPNPSGGGVSVK